MKTTIEILSQAKELGVCDKLLGTENAEELFRLFLTVQGIEFCTKNNFPDLETVRSFKGELAESYGIFIDTDVVLSNRSKVVLLGDAHADLTYDDPSKGHNVILMHGASAKITASGYSVVFVNNAGGTVETEATENALIL